MIISHRVLEYFRKKFLNWKMVVVDSLGLSGGLADCRIHDGHLSNLIDVFLVFYSLGDLRD